MQRFDKVITKLQQCSGEHGSKTKLLLKLCSIQYLLRTTSGNNSHI